MSRVFVIADTHFGHKKVTEFRPFVTVEAHDRTLVEKWNATVKPYETVWHLGDVFLGGADQHVVLASLNGTKRLVLGNHDVYRLELYKQYFTKIYGAAELHGCILTHVPVHPLQLERRYRLNIHGHTHSSRILHPQYRCVSVEQTGYQPVLFAEIAI